VLPDRARIDPQAVVVVGHSVASADRGRSTDVGARVRKHARTLEVGLPAGRIMEVADHRWVAVHLCAAERIRDRDLFMEKRDRV
jgi:hypothetical protein